MFDLFSGPAADAVRLFLAIALGIACVSLLWESLRRIRRERLVSRQLEELDRQPGTPSHDRLFRLDDSEDEHQWLAWLTAHLPHRDDLRQLLARADSDWGIGTFLILTLGLGAAAGLGSSFVGVGPVGSLLAAAGTATLPYFYLVRRLKRRAAAFEEHFPEAIELLARSLRAGHALVTGLEVVAEEAPAPVNQEFMQVFEQQRFGLPLEESLLGMADRVDSVDVRMFVTGVMIQRESGGNLAEVLDNLATLIRERFKFARQLRVHTAQGRMTGYLLAVLPLAVGMGLFLVTRDYMMPLFTEPLGRLMLMGTLGMQILGFLWIRKIVNVEF